MKQLNEDILNQSFGMENDSIYELTIRLSGYEKECLTSIIDHHYKEEEKHFWEMEDLGEEYNKQHIFNLWSVFIKCLPEEYKSELLKSQII